jgi:VIT1/CCC1 family predicted Fe2+/Mn2+ transporter
MKWLYLLKRRENSLPVVLGLVDGILTAMLLTARKILGYGTPVDSGIALKVAIYAFATAGFVFYIGRYAELRSQLVHAAAQLNLRKKGKLATTYLGRTVLHEAVREAFISGGSSFVSALLPLSLAALFPFIPQLSILVSIFLLGLLGFVIGRAVRGSSVLWSVNLVLGGLFMTVLGFGLHIM